MLGIAHRGLWRILSLVVATVVVGIGAYVVGLNAINGMQRSHAEHVARTFGDYLVSQFSDLGDLIASSPLPTVGGAVSSIPLIGTVEQFHIYDRRGTLRVDSGLAIRDTRAEPLSDDVDPTAQTVVETGKSAYRLLEGDGIALPRYYADVSVPLIVAGETVGVLSVITNETRSWPNLFDQFRNVLLQVALLIAAAFAIPLVLYLQKARQLARAATRLRQSTQYDEMTGCLNRVTFTRILEELMSTAGQRGLSVAVHFIDLDRFNDVNESLGHAVGDEVLKETAERLRKLMGTRERIARLGADEFAICQPYYVNSPQIVVELADNIVKALARPFAVGERQVQIGASAGYSYHPRDGATVAELMRAADIAIHKAKETSRGKAVAFDPSMEAERQRRQRIEARMRAALAEDGFEIYFQPLFETMTGRLRGFESLLRLEADDGTAISPAEFVPIAEEVGLIGDIGTWAMRESCRIALQWPADLVVSVNLSPAQFGGGEMAQQVREVLEWSGLPSARLELEVTESVLITDTDNVLDELRAIKALGVSVALDDFGTGYSSLGYLWRFPFDKLKVDKSFMRDLEVEGSKSREILKTIIALGRVLDLKVTAEGVETEQQAAVLRELRCDLVQGFLYGRPMCAIDVAATILRDRVPARGGIEPVRAPGMHALAERARA